MQYSKLLAKLSEGDMTTTEAKYQNSRLTHMYNKFKVKQKKMQQLRRNYYQL